MEDEEEETEDEEVTEDEEDEEEDEEEPVSEPRREERLSSSSLTDTRVSSSPRARCVFFLSLVDCLKLRVWGGQAFFPSATFLLTLLLSSCFLRSTSSSPETSFPETLSTERRCVILPRRVFEHSASRLEGVPY